MPGKRQRGLLVSTHSHPKVAAMRDALADFGKPVSTHSHPKVAALNNFSVSFSKIRFNTQPPEGGCWAVLPKIK